MIEIIQITNLLLKDVSKGLLEKDISVVFDEKVVSKVAKEGFDEQFGARPLRRFIQSKIENLLAQKILREEVKRGNKVNVTVDASNEIQITVVS